MPNPYPLNGPAIITSPMGNGRQTISIKGRMPLRITLVMLVFFLNACWRTRQGVTRTMVIGTYEFDTDGPTGRMPVHPFGERLRLDDNGTYELSNAGGLGGQRSVTTGHWVFTNGDPPIVDLDHSGYPVELDGDRVRLVIDGDAHARYDKVR